MLRTKVYNIMNKKYLKRRTLKNNGIHNLLKVSVYKFQKE